VTPRVNDPRYDRPDCFAPEIEAQLGLGIR